ncbi:hypothetical protein N7497_011975 [Penicillium chrysogenum]|uniref:Uncharacterized protein n=1 Tax=Penicillium chrysogenum TaxID=5076 RepID=A0ABQ8WT05_PENCH|nr:hypothetical protein N7505_000142 [Penicillium chrysogenum]KAJ6141082.1 hypothetical protein N7497_011975 [Penicillium chrysogenum]
MPHQALKRHSSPLEWHKLNPLRGIHLLILLIQIRVILGMTSSRDRQTTTTSNLHTRRELHPAHPDKARKHKHPDSHRANNRNGGISASDEVATRRTDESLVIRLNTDQEQALRNKPVQDRRGSHERYRVAVRQREEVATPLRILRVPGDADAATGDGSREDELWGVGDDRVADHGLGPAVAFDEGLCVYGPELGVPDFVAVFAQRET